MTWTAFVGLGLFLVMLVFAILRPILDRHDGPERGVPQVDQPAINATGP